MKPCEPRPRKNNTNNKRGDSGRHFLLRVLYNAVWWAQSYSPDPPLPPPPIHTSSVFSLPAKKKSFWEPSEQHHSKNRMHRQSGASGRRFLLRVYNHRERTRRCVVDTIVLPRPSTTTTTYPHIISLPCLQKKNLFGNPPSSTTLKIACTAKVELPEGAFYYAYITIEKGHDDVWWTQSYSPDPPLPPPPIHTA